MSDKPDYRPKVIHINRAQENNQHAFDKFEDAVSDAINEAYRDGILHSLVIYLLHMYLQIETNRIFEDDE